MNKWNNDDQKLNTRYDKAADPEAGPAVKDKIKLNKPRVTIPEEKKDMEDEQNALDIQQVAAEIIINEIYDRARRNAVAVAEEFFSPYVLEDKKRADAVKAGSMQSEEYKKWRTSLLTGYMYDLMIELIAVIYTRADMEAADALNKFARAAYSLAYCHEEYRESQILRGIQ